VVHQRDSLQAGRRGGAGDVRQPACRACRVFIPRKPRQLQHQPHPHRPFPLLAGRRPRAGGVRRLGPGLPGGCHQVPSLAADLHDGRPHPPQLLVKRGRWHRQVALPVPPPALRRVGIEEHYDGGHPAAPGQPQVAMPARRVKPERVHHRGQPAPQPRRRDLVKQGKGVVRRRQVVLAAPHHRAQPV